MNLTGDQLRQIGLSCAEATLRLEQAISKGKMKNIQQALDEGAIPAWCQWKKKNGKPNGIVLGRAMKQKNIAVLDLLLEKGADLYQELNGKNVLTYALDFNYEDGLTWAIQHSSIEHISEETQKTTISQAIQRKFHHSLEQMLVSGWGKSFERNFFWKEGFYSTNDIKSIDLLFDYGYLDFSNTEVCNDVLSQQYHVLFTHQQHNTQPLASLSGYLKHGGQLNDTFWGRFVSNPIDKAVSIFLKYDCFDLGRPFEHHTLGDAFKLTHGEKLNEYYPHLKASLDRHEMNEYTPASKNALPRMRF